ncbi:hypothetical protein D3C81_2246330 [compost metagenome]
MQQVLSTFMADLLGKIAHPLGSFAQVMGKPQAVVALQRGCSRACTLLQGVKLLGGCGAVVLVLLGALVLCLAQ